jgi:transposase
MKGLTLTTKEQTRLQILNSILERRWFMREAAEVLGVSERHGWRLLAAYRKEGAAALAHGNRGRVPRNATPAVVRQQVVAMAQERYGGINHTHLAELLAEREGLVLSRATVRRLLVGAGVPSPRRRRPPRHRCRRQRMPQEGMLLQMDGSHHAWLEDRGPVLTLLLAVDDATGTVPHALFREQEDTRGYMLLLHGIIERCGIPLAVYTDRHAVFGRWRRGPDEILTSLHAGKPTQCARALRELGVTQIFAHSPEAKGRVERANGTLQDRLVAELRLAGVSTLAEANDVLEEFLPRFNQRFGVPAAESESAYREIPEGLDIDGVLCIKETRRVAKDNTVRYRGRTLQLFPETDQPSYAWARVEVQERLDGRLLVCYRGKLLTPEEAPPLAAELRARAEACPLDVSLKMAEDSWMTDPIPERRTRAQKPRSILGWDGDWYRDEAKKSIHGQLVHAGMERARQQGKRIGRPSVTERDGFSQRFVAVVERLEQGAISRRQAAEDLDIGYATLKRLLDARLWPSDKSGQDTLAPAAITTYSDWKDYDDILAGVLT